MISKKYIIISCILLILLQGIIIETAFATPIERNVIIGFRHPVGPNDDKIVQNHGGLPKKNFHIIPAISATIPDNRISELKNDPNVLYVENETIYKMADAYSDEYNNSWGVQHIGSEFVNDNGINGTGIKVAVLDTGIDYTNIDLKDNYKGGYNFVFNNTNPYDDNCLTLLQTCHGTHVSGIIGAERNGIGVVGVAPNASIYAVKVLDATGFGSTSWILSGIQWAVDNNMNIISMSFSGDDDIAVHDAIDVAYQSGILLVAAAGNTYGGNVTYPAGYDSVIAVTAIDNFDNRADFSPIDPKIELSAPGVNINSTIGSTINGGYGIRSGTSMAAPHVTGVAALVYSTSFPDVDGNGIKDNRDVRLILDNTARDLGFPGKDSIYGYGIVDAQNATMGIPYNPPPPPPTFIPPDPINLQKTIGKNWVNYTWSPGIGNITDSYNVNVNGFWFNGTNTYENYTIVPPGLVNITVWAFNVSGKGTLSKGSISQSTQIPLDLTLIRTNSTPINDSKGVNLSQGNYLITINNINISELDMNVYDNGTIVKNLSQIFVFNNSSLNNIPAGKTKSTKSNVNYGNSNNVDINLNIQKSLNVVFVPYGNRGATCEIIIKEV